MELNSLIEIIEKDSTNNSIIVPRLETSFGVTKNIEFIKMGTAKDEYNYGKTIYLSKDTLLQASLRDIYYNCNFGDTVFGKELARKLDSIIFSITNNHIKEYIRSYDGETHKEKIFLPLESEVFGKVEHSRDKKTLNKYPIWDEFLINEDLKKKNFNDELSWWTLANKSYKGCCCFVDDKGKPNFAGLECSVGRISIAFCI